MKTFIINSKIELRNITDLFCQLNVDELNEVITKAQHKLREKMEKKK